MPQTKSLHQNIVQALSYQPKEKQNTVLQTDGTYFTDPEMDMKEDYGLQRMYYMAINANHTFIRGRTTLY